MTAGICSLSVLVRGFPAVSLPALAGLILTLWAIHRRYAGRAIAA